MKVLPLQDHIAVGYALSHKWSVLTAQFGDGYKQVAPNGINNKRSTWTITYKNLNEEKYNTVMNFLDSLKGTETFEATPRGYTGPIVCMLADNEVSVTETAVQHETDYTYRDISFTVEIQ